MKILVVLYPLAGYIDPLIYHLYEVGADTRKIFDGYNNLIDEKYRQNGYKVCFILPKGHRVDSQYRGMDSRIKVADQDLVLIGNRTMDDRDYPDGPWNHMNFDMLPEYFNGPDNEVVVAGFHDGACVKDTARELAATGSNVSTDKELTDFYFRYQFSREWERILSESRARERASI